MATRYRLARKEDSAALLDIYRPYIADTVITFETEAPTLDEYTERVAGIAAFFPYIVAEDGGDICGYAYASPFHERAGYRYSVSVSVYVRGECKGRGMGKELYRRLFAVLPLQGVRMAYALITVPNEPSVGLHAAFGFREVAILRGSGYKLGNWLDVLYMEKKVGEFDGRPGPLKPVAEVPAAEIVETFSR